MSKIQIVLVLYLQLGGKLSRGLSREGYVLDFISLPKDSKALH